PVYVSPSRVRTGIWTLVAKLAPTESACLSFSRSHSGELCKPVGFEAREQRLHILLPFFKTHAIPTGDECTFEHHQVVELYVCICHEREWFGASMCVDVDEIHHTLEPNGEADCRYVLA